MHAAEHDAPTGTHVVTHTLAPHQVALLMKKVEKANSRASRAGLGEPFALTEVEHGVTTRTVAGIRINDPWVKVEVTGECGGKPGWTLAAVVTWEEAGPVLRTVPGVTVDPLPRPTEKRCDHCGLVRNRYETYLAVDPDGQVRQVGRQCLGAYTGILVGWVAMMDDVAEAPAGHGPGAGRFTYDLRSLLRVTIRLVDTLGYVKRDAPGVSTRERVEILWHGPSGSAQREIRRETEEALLANPRADADVDAEVEAIIEWGENLGGSDYLANLSTILRGERVSERSLGFAVSAVPSFRRAREQEIRRAAAQADAAPVPTGRIVVEGLIASVRRSTNHFGSTLKMRVVADTGWAVWGSVPRELSTHQREPVVGDRVRFTATVKVSDDDPTFGFFTRPTAAEYV